MQTTELIAARAALRFATENFPKSIIDVAGAIVYEGSPMIRLGVERTAGTVTHHNLYRTARDSINRALEPEIARVQDVFDRIRDSTSYVARIRRWRPSTHVETDIRDILTSNSLRDMATAEDAAFISIAQAATEHMTQQALSTRHMGANRGGDAFMPGAIRGERHEVPFDRIRSANEQVERAQRHVIEAQVAAQVREIQAEQRARALHPAPQNPAPLTPVFEFGSISPNGPIAAAEAELARRREETQRRLEMYAREAIGVSGGNPNGVQMATFTDSPRAQGVQRATRTDTPRTRTAMARAMRTIIRGYEGGGKSKSRSEGREPLGLFGTKITKDNVCKTCTDLLSGLFVPPSAEKSRIITSGDLQGYIVSSVTQDVGSMYSRMVMEGPPVDFAEIGQEISIQGSVVGIIESVNTVQQIQEIRETGTNRVYRVPGIPTSTISVRVDGMPGREVMGMVGRAGSGGLPRGGTDWGAPTEGYTAAGYP